MCYAIEDGVGDSRVSDSVIPVSNRQLRGDDYRLASVAVFYDVMKQRTFLGIQRDQEKVVEDEQRTAFDFLELCFECAFGLGHFEQAEQFGGVCVVGPYAIVAGMILWQ